MSARLSQYARENLHAILLACLTVLYLVLSVIPFLANGPHPLGYDTGFYRRYLINPVEGWFEKSLRMAVFTSGI